MFTRSPTREKDGYVVRVLRKKKKKLKFLICLRERVGEYIFGIEDRMFLSSDKLVSVQCTMFICKHFVLESTKRMTRKR